jgi:hypothetical protein
MFTKYKLEEFDVPNNQQNTHPESPPSFRSIKKQTKITLQV